MRTYQLPPPVFLKRLFLTWTNFTLWGFEGSGTNFLLYLMASSCSFSSFHCLIYFNSTKILFITSSFCSRVFSNFLNTSVNFYICSSLLAILSLSSTFYAFNIYNYPCIFFNFIYRTWFSSTSFLTVGIVSSIFFTIFPKGISTVNDIFPATIVSSWKEASRKANKVAGFPKRKSRFLSFLMYSSSTLAE